MSNDKVRFQVSRCYHQQKLKTRCLRRLTSGSESQEELLVDWRAVACQSFQEYCMQIYRATCTCHWPTADDIKVVRTSRNSTQLDCRHEPNCISQLQELNDVNRRSGRTRSERSHLAISNLLWTNRFCHKILERMKRAAGYGISLTRGIVAEDRLTDRLAKTSVVDKPNPWFRKRVELEFGKQMMTAYQ